MKSKLAVSEQTKTADARRHVVRLFRAFLLFPTVAGFFLFADTFLYPLHAASGGSCDPPPTGIISWWPGDGSANDITSTNNGVLEGGATATATGLVGQAFSFDGTNGYVQIPNNAALNPTNFTVEAWVRFSSLNSAGSGGSPAGDQYIVFKQNANTYNFEGIDLSKTRIASGDVFEFLVTSASGQSAEIDSVTPISTNVWYHIAAARGSNFIQLYVNGQLAGQTNVTFAQSYGTLPLYFGTSGQSYWDHKLAGNLDEVTLYNRPLASNEIAAIYAAGSAGKCKSVGGLTIATQPQSQTVAVGGNTSFTVAASGTAPLSYQWQFNGTAMTNATNTLLILTNVQPAQAGNYTVIVTNSLASVTSSVAVLTVAVPPAILTQPASQTAAAGANVSFSITASGAAPLSYQWQFNGTAIAGATNTLLTLANVQLAAAGNYLVIVTNSTGYATSAIAVLNVIVPGSCDPPPTGIISWWPGDGSANDITSTNNGVLKGGATATAAGLVGQAFSFDGTNSYVQIPNAAALNPTNFTIEGWVRFSSLNSTGSGGSPAGDQYIVFKQNANTYNFEGIDLSKTRIASGDVFEFLVTSASGQSAEIDSAATISTNVWYHVAAARGSNFIQLYVNGQLAGQTNVTFAQSYGTLPLYFGTSGQSYWDHKLAGNLDEVTLYNRPLASNEIAAIYAAGSAGKCKGASGVILTAQITTQPQSQTAVEGSNVLFTVTAGGTSPLSYQWQFNSAAIAGATNSLLTLTNVQPAQAGNYAVIVTNSLASVTSSVAVLTVLVPPAILTQPASQSVAAGTNVSFSITASGTAPLNYQWQFNGAAITGATNATLTLTNVPSAAAGNYTVVVANAAAAMTSAVAVLSVTGPPAILTQPASQSVAAGANVSFSVTASGTAPLNYQWQFGGATIPGATNSLLTLTNAQPAQAGDYAVIVTNPMGSSTSAAAVLTVQPAAGTVLINGAVTYQTIDGFGANINHRSWNTNGELEPVLNALINQAGFTQFHVIFDNNNWEQTNDNSDADVMNWSYYNNIYNSTDFQKLWGIMAYLNQQGITNGLVPDFEGPVALWMGGLSLTPGMEDEYAETIASALVYARSNQNLQFSVVGAVNEPDLTYTGINLTGPAQYVTVMHDLAVQLNNNGMGDVLFSGPDLADTSTTWLGQIMTDPLIMSKLAHFGLHSYQNETPDATGVYSFIQQSAYPNTHFWMTEYNVWCASCYAGTGGDNSWSYGLGTATYMLDLLAEGASAGIVWEGYDSVYYPYNSSTGGNEPGQWSYWGLFAVDNINASPLTYTPREGFYTLAQIALYVRPGAQRIGLSSSSSPLTMLAFYNTNNAQFTLTGVNTTSSASSLSCALESLPAIPGLAFYYTSSATNLCYAGQVAVNNGAFSVLVPANCVFTLTYSNTATPLLVRQLVTAPHFLTPLKRNGTVSLSLAAAPGFTYQIEVSTNLADWTTAANIASTNGTIQFLETNANSYSQRFYRAVLQK